MAVSLNSCRSRLGKTGSPPGAAPSTGRGAAVPGAIGAIYGSKHSATIVLPRMHRPDRRALERSPSRRHRSEPHWRRDGAATFGLVPRLRSMRTDRKTSPAWREAMQ